MLGLGAKFIPTPSFRTDEDVTRDVLYFCFRLVSRYSKASTDDDDDTRLDFKHRSQPSRDIVILRSQLAARCHRSKIPIPLTNWFKKIEADALASARTARRLHGRIRYNLAPSLRSALKALQQRKDVNTDNADKNVGYMLYSTRRYLSEIAKHLHDHDVYEPVTADTVSVIKRIEDSAPFRNGESAPLPNRVRFKMSLHDQRLARFYIIWKIHKDAHSPPGRPIASAIGTVTANASRWLDSMLQPTLVDHRWILRDSTQLVRILDSIDVSSHRSVSLVTLDVTALYPSIDIDRGLDALRQFLPLTSIDPSLHAFILDLASWVLRNNFVSDPEGIVFRQIRGTAMGTPFAVVYATIFMIILEEPVVTRYARDIAVYRRFIDDIFLLWTGSYDHLIDFITDLRSRDPLIQFTRVISSTSVDFMDISISLDRDRTISYTLYSKPLNNYLFVPAHSYHRPHTLSAFIRAELLRRLEKCSHADDFIDLKHSFFHHLRARGYRTDMLIPAFDSVRWRDRPARLALTALRASRHATTASPRLPFYFITTHTPEFDLWKTFTSFDTTMIDGLHDFDLLYETFGLTSTVIGTRSAPALRRLLHH